MIFVQMEQGFQQWLEVIDEFLQGAKKPLIVILGPTASGKTGVSIDIGTHLGNAEVVNADSRQLYRYLDIGTAKIKAEEMQGIPHHLFSVLDPKEAVTIAWYQKEAMRVIDDIRSRGRIPLLVGGSMLYISAVIDGLLPMASDPAIREKLSADYDRDGGVSLHAKLAQIDTESAAAIPVQNKVYVIRAMEIFEMTGKPKSAQKQVSSCPYDLLILGVRQEKEELNRRIEARVEQMFADGWVAEVRALMAKGYGSDDPGMESTGYREILDAIAAGRDPAAVKGEIAAKTRQYAKRQMTWWRGEGGRIQWLSL